MAKMKIYELAKEIDKTNKEILTFLAEKGIEAKSHMNTIEEDTVEMVRKAFSVNKEAPKETNPKAEARTEAKSEPAKKKKSIIFVSNPHNSKMPGARSQGGGQKSQGGQRPQKNRPGKPAEKELNPFRPQVPKPVVKPVVIERTEPAAPSNDTRRTAQKNENQRQEQSRNHYRQDGNHQPQGMGRGNGNSERNNNQGYQKNNDNRREGAPNRGGNKPYNNNDRGGRPNAGEKTNYKKPQPQKPFSDAPMGEPEKRRDEEKRRQGQERDKRSKKDLIYEEDNANIKGKNKAGKFIKPEKKVEEKAEEQIKVITLPESLTIKELAEKMKIQPSAIVKKLFLQGQIVTVNQEIDYETAEEIAIEYEII